MYQNIRVLISALVISVVLVSSVSAEPLYHSRHDYLNRTPSVEKLERRGEITRLQSIQQLEASAGEPDIYAVWTGATKWMTGWPYLAGGETFGESIFKGKNFFGTSLADGDYVDIRIIFRTGVANQTLCQTFRWDMGFESGGVGTFPGQAWDVSDPENARRLNMCYIEDNYYEPVDLTWDPSGFDDGKREILYIMNSDYDSTGSTYAGFNAFSDAPSLDILYNWWPAVAAGHTFFENEPCTLTISANYVTNFTAILSETGSGRVVTMSWGNYVGDSPMDHFSIVRSTSSPATSLLEQVGSSTFAYVDSTLEFNQDYFYRVEARDASDSIVGHSFEAAIPGKVSENVQFVSNWNGRSLYGDCWGYVDTSTGNEYALICARNEGVSIIDINVSPPVEVGFMPILNFGNDCKDVKVYKHYAIIISEYEDGQIFNISNVTNPIRVSTFSSEGGGGAHNCLVDGDFLYVVGNHAVGGLEIFDISNPAAPNNVGDFEPFYYHDLDIYNDTVAATGIYGDGVDLIDVSNKAAPALVQRFNYAGSGAHNCEFLQGMKYLAVGDEIGDEPHTRIFDLQDLSSIDKVADILLEVNQPTHNCYVKNDILYIAHYSLGLRMINVADPTKPKEVGYFDTYLDDIGGFVGAWGVYPYFLSGKIIVSDMQTGLYVFELEESDTCLIQTPGDADGNGMLEVADVAALNAFLENTGPAPIPLANGDFNGDCIVNKADADELLDSISANADPVQIVDCTCLEPTVEFNCCVGNRGDVNNDGNDANILDLNYLVNYIFRFGTAAPCPKEADTDGNGISGNILDLNYLINWIFRFGPAPGTC